MGRMMYCCQKTIQYPEKITRNSMKRQLVRTVRKFRPTSLSVGTDCPASRRGSLKKISTATNISNTLIDEMMKTFSTGRCLRTLEATYGPAVEPMFTRV